MNTASQQHSPLESYLLFRAIEEHGLDFARISDRLRSIAPITIAPSYDAARLSPESLQELFLNLLWEELNSENDSSSTRPDGDGLSPASKKRKLHRPTLRDAPHHVREIVAVYYKVQDSYINSAVKAIQEDERRYDEVQERISRLEEYDKKVDDVIPATRAATPNGVAHDYSVKRESGPLNGINATAKPSPKLPSQSSPPVPPPIPASAPSSTLPQGRPQIVPQTAHRQPTSNGSAPRSHTSGQALVGAPSTAPVGHPITTTGPAPVSSPTLAPSVPLSVASARTASPPLVSVPGTTSIPTPPALAPVPTTSSGPSLPLGQQSLSRPQPGQPQGAAKTPNGTVPVLQPPRGIPFQPPPQQFTPPPAAEGLQRPDQIARSRQPTLPPVPGAQHDAQAVSRWEPSYQGNSNQPMQAIPHGQQHQHSQFPIPTTQAYQTTQASQHLQQQRPPQPTQQTVPPLPRPLQPQTSKPLQQQTLPTAPQNTAHAPYLISQPQPQPPRHSPPSLPPQLHQTQQPHHHHVAHAPPQVSHQLPPSHLAQIRPAPETQSFANQPWSPYQQGAQNRINQSPQSTHPSYQNYPQSGVRSPANQSPLPSPTGLHPRAGQLAPPQSHQPQQQQQQQQQQPPPPPPQPQVLQPLQSPSPFHQRRPSSGPPSPAVPPSETQRGYHSPYQQHPRGLVPDRLQHNRPPVATPVQPSAARFALIPSGPQTPVSSVPLRLFTGSGTKWSMAATPSTPMNAGDWRFKDVESPAQEPLSPPLPKAVLASAASRDEIKSEHPAPPSQLSAPPPLAETPSAKRKAGRPRGSQRPQDETSPSVAPVEPTRRSPASTAEEPSQQEPLNQSPQQQSSPRETPKLNVDLEPTKIKDEVTTPNPMVDGWDTAAEESVGGRRQHKRQTKRKRDDMSPTPGPTRAQSQVSAMPDVTEVGANTVWWTRSFHKVSTSTIERILRHKFANMFAAPIREKDAPGYHKRIIQPQDLKSIKAAINAGNRAAAQAAAALPGGDPGTSTVELPLSEDLIPPKAIINSNQLERELTHMFANAIMYNPDEDNGPGPMFMMREAGERKNDLEGAVESFNAAAAPEGGQQDHVLGYKVDEYAVVRDTREISKDVGHWLSELRIADRSKQQGATGTSTRQASVAHGEQQPNTGAVADMTMDDVDDQTATEPETAVKRRRTTRHV